MRVAVLGLALVAGCSEPKSQKPVVPQELREEAVAALRDVMKSSDHWAKIHAAEWLLQLGYSQGVADEFRRELAVRGDEPRYRVGIWRVLAEASQSPRDYSQWTDRIKGACFADNSPDRVYAAESLAKLGVSLDSKELKRVTDAASGTDARLAANCCWALAVADQDHPECRLNRLIGLLERTSVEARRTAALALRQLGLLDHNQWQTVVDRAERETDALAKLRLFGTALVAAPADAPKEELSAIRRAALKTRSLGQAQLDLEIIRILADAGRGSDVLLLEAFLHPAELPTEEGRAAMPSSAEFSAAAADAILHRPAQPRPWNPLDRLGSHHRVRLRDDRNRALLFATHNEPRGLFARRTEDATLDGRLVVVCDTHEHD